MPSPLSGGNALVQIKGVCVMTHTNQRGAWAEDRVATLLHTRGWSLIERNWCCRWGELDLVLQKNSQLLVVEVKGRRSMAWGLCSVDSAKRRRLGKAIGCWRSLHPEMADRLLQVAVALVPLPPARGAVRWYSLEQLC